MKSRFQRVRNLAISVTMLFLWASGQEPNPTQQGLAAIEGGKVPVYKIEVVARTIPAVNYHHRSGYTTIDFRGTELMPEAKGRAMVESKTGVTKIDVDVERVTLPRQFGQEFMTYVLWAITPEGRAENLGEIVLNGAKARLQTTTEMQVFGLIVTAEPYYAVTQPSDLVVMENRVRDDTKGTIETVSAKFELLRRGSYRVSVNRSLAKARPGDVELPPDLQQAYNALEIAQQAGAAQYAPETLEKATTELTNAIGFYNNNQDIKQVITIARESTQHSEDARLITLRRQRSEEVVRTSAEVQRARDMAEKSEQDRQRALQEMQDAKAKVELEQSRQSSPGQYERGYQPSVAQDQARLKAELQSQFNGVMPTQQTARGLVMSVPDDFFNGDQPALLPAAREKLAKMSGLILAHRGLQLQIAGPADGRAQAVRAYLVSQGVSTGAIDVRRADAASRRVEILVSGEPIGRQVTGLVR